MYKLNCREIIFQQKLSYKVKKRILENILIIFWLIIWWASVDPALKLLYFIMFLAIPNLSNFYIIWNYGEF